MATWTRRVVVTGANKGIGRAIVERLLEEHADVFVYMGARDTARGEATRAELIARDPAAAERTAVLALDVASDASVAAAAARVESAGPLYALVNNAGCFGTPEEVFNTNLDGVRRCVEAFAPALLRHTSERARVVTISSGAGPTFVAKCTPERQAFFRDGAVSLAGLRAEAAAYVAALTGAAADSGAALAAGGYPAAAEDSSYGASKAFVNVYTMVAAAAWPGLTVTACSPGLINTDLLAPVLARMGKTAAEAGALTPREGTRAAFFLLFGDATSGHYYGSDGLRSPLDRYRAPGSPAFAG